MQLERPSNLPSASKIFLLAFIYGLIWFGTLQYRHLIPSDEGRYAEMAREMLVTGDWVTPRYNGYQYFEKPPLQVWATASAFKLFGVGDWQARLWTALTGFLTIIAIGFTGTKIYGQRAGLLAGIVLASSPMWIIGGHINSLDMGLSAFLAGALCSLLIAQTSHNKTTTRNWMWVCWASMALAMLSKGLIGVALPAMVLIAYSLSNWDWQLWKRLHILSGVFLFLLITAPWFILVSQRNLAFFDFFFIHEHLQRFTQDAHSRTGPMYYFVPLLLLGFLPWLPQLLGSIGCAWQDRRRNFSGKWLLLCWSVIIFVFFSISHSKLPGYIIPIFPALALLAGVTLDRSLGNKNTLTWPWQIQTLAGALLGASGFFFLAEISKQARPDEYLAYAQYTQWIIAALLALIIFSLLASWLSKRHGLASIGSFAGGFFLCAMIAGTGHETLGRAVSGIDLVEQIKGSIPDKVNFYSVRILDHTVPFYLGKTMIMVEFPDELEFGVQQEPELWLPTLEAFITRWREDQTAYALMVPELYMELQKQKLPMQEVARDSRRVIVKHPAITTPERP
jgi:4-amino-4-deoxy-L-arabinose transferase-like glycosyltransferase